MIGRGSESFDQYGQLADSSFLTRTMFVIMYNWLYPHALLHLLPILEIPTGCFALTRSKLVSWDEDDMTLDLNLPSRRNPPIHAHRPRIRLQ